MVLDYGLLQSLHRMLQQLTDLDDRIRRGPIKVRVVESNEGGFADSLAECEGRLSELRRSSNEKTMQLNEREAKIEDMKARDIVVIDVSDKSTVTDTMVVCSGNSKRHVSSIADNLIVECKHAEHAPLSVEGKDTGEWVLVDLGEAVVHVIGRRERGAHRARAVVRLFAGKDLRVFAGFGVCGVLRLSGAFFG